MDFVEKPFQSIQTLLILNYYIYSIDFRFSINLFLHQHIFIPTQKLKISI